MPIFRWTTDDLPIRWQSKRELRAEVTVLKKHYTAQFKMLRDQLALLDDVHAYITTLENAAESDLQAFEDVLKAEMALVVRYGDLRRELLAACDAADAVRAPSGRTGRVGTKAIRTLLA